MARALAPDHIPAVAGATLEALTGPMRGVNRSRVMAVLAQQDDRWVITAFHNTLVAEGG